MQRAGEFRTLNTETLLSSPFVLQFVAPSSGTFYPSFSPHRCRLFPGGILADPFKIPRICDLTLFSLSLSLSYP